MCSRWHERCRSGGSDDALHLMPRSRAPFSTGGFYPPSSHPYPLGAAACCPPPDRSLFLFLSSHLGDSRARLFRSGTSFIDAGRRSALADEKSLSFLKCAVCSVTSNVQKSNALRAGTVGACRWVAVGTTALQRPPSTAPTSARFCAPSLPSEACPREPVTERVRSVAGFSLSALRARSRDFGLSL
jgi:hypothetical protein